MMKRFKGEAQLKGCKTVCFTGGRLRILLVSAEKTIGKVSVLLQIPTFTPAFPPCLFIGTEGTCKSVISPPPHHPQLFTNGREKKSISCVK